MLELSSIDGSVMVAAKLNNFSPNLVREIGRSNGSKNSNFEELWYKPLHIKGSVGNFMENLRA